MKIRIRLMMAMAVLLMVFSSCSNKEKTFDLNTEEGFWDEFNFLETEADLILNQIREKKEVSKKDLKELQKIQLQLEKTYDIARESNYYDKIAWYLDEESTYYNKLIVVNTSLVIDKGNSSCAVLAINAKGLIATQENYYMEKEKEYTPIDDRKDAYILVEGTETGLTLYVIQRIQNFEVFPVIVIVLLNLVVGIMGLILSKKVPNKVVKLCSIAASILLIVGSTASLFFV